MYRHFFKRLIDFVLSLVAIIVLIPVWLIISLAIVIDDPGPVFFTQKRVGKNKKLFKILKFRTMKMCTPHDMPTHMLENPEQYITKVGGFLRKTSLDELPQIFNIFAAKMSIIGPRPALWNQDDLIAERDRYGANDVRPGLTGWAQINGRDELEIPVKAKLDGEYAAALKKGKFRGFAMDVKCFFGTIKSVLKHDGVVEGGTGELHKEERLAASGGNDPLKEGTDDSAAETQTVQSGDENEPVAKAKKGKIFVISAHTPSLFWFRLDMMQRFVSLGYDVVAVANESEDEWKGKFATYGIVYKQIYVNRNGTNPLKDLKTLKAIKKLLKRERPEKVFAYNAKAVIYSGIAAKKLKIEHYPLIAGMGSIFLSNSLKNRILQKVMCSEYKKALKKSKAVFFQNKDDSELFLQKRLVTQQQITYIHGSGVNLEKFKVESLPTSIAFLFIGRLIKDKGVREYLDACKTVKEQYPNVKCMLVGPYDTNPTSLKREELSCYVDSNIVEYYGEQSDVRPFLKQCSVFILPSYREGTPKTVLEAMATGRAIITTDAPGCKETVVDGENGFLVPIKNAEILAAKMIDLIKNPQLVSEFAAKSRKKAEERFSVEIVNDTICKTMQLVEN